MGKVYVYNSRVSGIIKFLGALSLREVGDHRDNNTCMGWDEMGYGILDGWWTKAGTFDSLLWVSQPVAGRPDNRNGKVEP